MWEHEIANLPSDEEVPKFDYEIPKQLSDCYLLGSLTGVLGKNNTHLDVMSLITDTGLSEVSLFNFIYSCCEVFVYART